MELELDPRVKPLPYKVKAMSRESPAAKGANVLDLDLRTHWSTGTNTKEWILLELDEPCLLSNIRIYNKSVLEWEITAGLRYKPEAFVKVRPRCEALKRDMSYPTNYTPCRYVRLSCLRGNPIAVFFIQLIGVSVKGLEPEFQPVINYLLPHIILHKQDAHDMHLELLQNMTCRLLVFLPYLEAELSTFMDTSDSNIRFFAMLAGPFYPILQVINERDAVKGSVISPDPENSRNNQPYITVSSNFEALPRRPHNQSMFIQPGSCSIAFRADAAILLLRRAFKDIPLGSVCRIAARALQKIIGPIIPLEQPAPVDSASSSISSETATAEMPIHAHIADYSILFGEEFEVPNENWNVDLVNVLDIASVEEGVLHVLYACAAHPALCSKLAESKLEFWSALPLIQSLLPALRPRVNSLDRVDESFGQWKHPFIEQALSQITLISSSSTFRPLLHACAGYLSSYCSSHAKTACVLLDLCSGSLSPWISTVTAKVDLAIDLTEDLLGIIQAPHQSIIHVRIALKYILLGLSGHLDDVLTDFKEHKHKLLFLIEMLEPFLEPALSFSNSLPGADSPIFSEKQEIDCSCSLNIIRSALRRPTVLPSLESEWRRGSVASSVLLSILGPNMSLPSDIDIMKCSTNKCADMRLCKGSSGSSIFPNASLSKVSSSNDLDGKTDGSDSAVRFDSFEEAGLLFAPSELKNTILMSSDSRFIGDNLETSEQINVDNEGTDMKSWILMDHFRLDCGFFGDYLNLKADYLKLVNLQNCELRSTEFRHLALDLCSQDGITAEGYDAAIDAFILAAECYINPFFMISFTPDSKLAEDLNLVKSLMNKRNSIMELKKDFLKTSADLEVISRLERKRDKAVIEILVQAAKVNKEYGLRQSKQCPEDVEHKKQDLSIHLPRDVEAVDAVTLLRQNQTLLFEFVIQQLRREQHLSHEVLLQALLFLLQSSTELLCPPEAVVDIILLSAENFSVLLTSLYDELKDGTARFDLEKLHGLHRRWSLLERLVIASSGSDNGVISRKITFGCQYRSLIPLSSWINKISKFSDGSPLSRFLGWMAVSRYAKQYLKEHLFFASDLSQLRLLLSVFADELAFVNNTSQHKVDESIGFKQSDNLAQLPVQRESIYSHALEQGDSFHVLYPSLQFFFPNLRMQFRTFGERILEAVALQLKCLPSSTIPEILRWFSDVCMCPYGETIKIRHITSTSSFDCLKGYTARNAKTLVLYILESLVTEHMESMLPEMPRIAQILISLCKTSYCDVAFLDSILRLLRPLISYFLKKVTLDENLLADASSSLDFESSSFKELFDCIKLKGELQIGPNVDKFEGFLMIYILGTLLPDLSLKRKIDILQSLLPWAAFTSSEPTSSFYNYLCAFKKVFESCEMLLEHNLEQFGLVVPSGRQLVGSYEMVSLHGEPDIPSTFSGYGDLRVIAKPTKEVIDTESIADLPNQQIHQLSNEELKNFSEVLEVLVLKLIPEIEKCWKLHNKLASQLTMKIARCYLLSSCLKFVDISDSTTIDNNGGTTPSPSSRDSTYFWNNGLQYFTKAMLTIQESGCWQTLSAMLDYLFRLPESATLDHGIRNICSAIKVFCLHAPMISWRLQTDKWLTYLFQRGMANFDMMEDLLVDLFSTMLSHREPEQRAVALYHLGIMVGLDTHDRTAKLSSTCHPNLGGPELATSLSVSAISNLASNTWDKVAALVLSDPSMILRSHAMALLSGYVPFITRSQRQSFLISASSILQGMGKLSPLMEEGLLTRLSLGLLANACLFSPIEDIALIPESIWRNLEQMETSKTGWLDDAEKSISSALSRLRTDLLGGKEALKDALSRTSTTKLVDPNFKSIRESILQVLPSLTSTQAYFDLFSKKADEESQELEEAEIEMDLLQKENVLQKAFDISNKDYITYDKKDVGRLQQIKDNILSLERSKLKEEVAARIQKRLIMRRSRQTYLEEVASREMELLQELDRERKNELEHEIERQRQLEHERARTQELQFNLDIERERQTQKELQKELEQLESGVRPSRREFSSNSSSRAREKFRERDNVRSGLDGGTVRLASTAQTSGSSFNASSTPAMVLSGSRSFSGQPPTILQPRDRSADLNINNDDNLEEGRDSGDTNSMGDPELSSAFETLAGFGSVPRRGSKSRQVMERREREGRREGKWERKHS